MFDYDPYTEELIEPVKSFVPEVTPGATDFDKLDPAQVIFLIYYKHFFCKLLIKIFFFK